MPTPRTVKLIPSDGDSSSSSSDDSLPQSVFAARKMQKENSAPKKRTKRTRKDDGSSDSSDDEIPSIDTSVARRKAGSIDVPRNITSTTQLFWQRRRKNNMTELYYPARLCPSDEAVGLDIPRTYDKSKKVLVQFIGFPAMGKYSLVSRGTLIPYHGRSGDGGGRSGSGAAGTWCENISELYRKQREREIKRKGATFRKTDLLAEMIFLERILKAAHECEREEEESDLSSADEDQSPCFAVDEANDGDVEDGEDDDCLDDDCLEEPYTQDLRIDSDDDGTGFRLDNGRKKEPIRPGDVVEYYSHVYVAGDKRGYRQATVLSVDPERSPILVLDNGEVIPPDTQVRRKMVMIGGKLQYHPGVYRSIESFKLTKDVPAGSGVAAGIRKEADRVGTIIRKKMVQFQADAEADGFAPMDIMNNYRGASSGSTKGKNRAKQRAMDKAPNSRQSARTTKSTGAGSPSSRRGRVSTAKKPAGSAKARSVLSSSPSSSSSSSSDDERAQGLIGIGGCQKSLAEVGTDKSRRQSKGVSSSSKSSSDSEREQRLTGGIGSRHKSIPEVGVGKSRCQSKGFSSSSSSSSSDDEIERDQRLTGVGSRQKSLPGSGSAAVTSVSTSRRTRGVKHPISYTEPSLNTKIRRGHEFFPKSDASSPALASEVGVSKSRRESKGGLSSSSSSSSEDESHRGLGGTGSNEKSAPNVGTSKSLRDILSDSSSSSSSSSDEDEVKVVTPRKKLRRTSVRDPSLASAKHNAAQSEKKSSKRKPRVPSASKPSSRRATNFPGSTPQSARSGLSFDSGASSTDDDFVAPPPSARKIIVSVKEPPRRSKSSPHPKRKSPTLHTQKETSKRAGEAAKEIGGGWITSDRTKKKPAKKSEGAKKSKGIEYSPLQTVSTGFSVKRNK